MWCGVVVCVSLCFVLIDRQTLTFDGQERIWKTLNLTMAVV